MSTTTNNATAEQRQFIECLKQTEVNREQRGQDFYCLELLSKQESPDTDLRDMTVLAHYYWTFVNFFVLYFDARTKIGYGFVYLGDPDCVEYRKTVRLDAVRKQGDSARAGYGTFYMPFVEKMWLPSGGVVHRDQTWKPATIRELKEKLVYSGILKNA